jgi:type II secretory pathway component HofQ
MLDDNMSLNDEIFDLIIAQALREDFLREIEMYKNMPNDHVFSDKFEKGVKSISKGLRRKERVTKLKKAAPKLATAAAAVVVVAALATNPVVAETARNIFMWITGDAARPRV